MIIKIFHFTGYNDHNTQTVEICSRTVPVPRLFQSDTIEDVPHIDANCLAYAVKKCIGTRPMKSRREFGLFF